MKTSIYDKLRAAEHSPAWDRASAYVIMHGADRAGQIKVKHPKDGMGPLEVFLWDWTSSGSIDDRGIQYGKASGMGYDKLAAALEGLKFGELIFKDHPTDWKHQLEEGGFTLFQAL